ncbi:sodium-coupled monocarboxylate transporter 1 isoform X2 [Parasteatoda tepidariorum]|uniref:sodium-coupled monocarboxylate transporter 1 isoform X2 n=1 Tax=Parasteatoda tepidariorum TaxID=114398 RepID=UPI001C71B405|nr:sodium-coupled monocarboxylate transporter 1 isoform X2 [Parasteatoda tepidariorum]
MPMKYQLGAVDLSVIAISLLISLAIGIYVQVTGKQKRTTEEFLMAGRGMSKFPVIISITVTMLSAFTMLSHPAEIYRFGLQRAMMIVSTIVGTYLASVIFIPVYFQTKVSTTNEIVFMSVVLYAPALALNAVTDLSLELSITVIGVVCTLYCTLGGLKAVLWTDVFQAGLMLLCFIVIYIKGIDEAGGVSEIYKRARDGQRLDIFNMDIDLTTRYTFLNVFIKGVVSALSYYGTSQIEVQRMLSISNVSKAKSSLVWSIVPVTILLCFCYFLGLILYSIFYFCDPILNKNQTGITKYDQVVPFYIVSRLSSIPGLTGICIAGIFSGSLSTISSALNSLSTVTVIDFIKPLSYSTWLTDSKAVLIAKGISVLYGVLCILIAFSFTAADSLMQITTVLMSVTEGPVLAVYLIAVLTRRSSEKCIIFGLVIGVAFSCWIGYGSVYSGYVFPSLPLRSDGCNNISSAISGGFTIEDAVRNESISLSVNDMNSDIFFLYKISFTWFSTLGCIVTLVCIIFATLITGWKTNVIPSDSLCLSPVTKLWKRKSRSENEEAQDLKEITE